MVAQSRRYCLGYFWVGSCLSAIFFAFLRVFNPSDDDAAEADFPYLESSYGILHGVD
jgi:hypothetical protein